MYLSGSHVVTLAWVTSYPPAAGRFIPCLKRDRFWVSGLL